MTTWGELDQVGDKWTTQTCTVHFNTYQQEEFREGMESMWTVFGGSWS